MAEKPPRHLTVSTRLNRLAGYVFAGCVFMSWNSASHCPSLALLPRDAASCNKALRSPSAHCLLASARISAKPSSLYRGTFRFLEEVFKVEGYCMKCMQKREIAQAREETMRDGRLALKGECPVCKAKISRIAGSGGLNKKGRKRRPSEAP